MINRFVRWIKGVLRLLFCGKRKSKVIDSPYTLKHYAVESNQPKSHSYNNRTRRQSRQKNVNGSWRNK
jgi:hypothetical protein